MSDDRIQPNEEQEQANAALTDEQAEKASGGFWIEEWETCPICGNEVEKQKLNFHMARCGQNNATNA